MIRMLLMLCMTCTAALGECFPELAIPIVFDFDSIISLAMAVVQSELYALSVSVRVSMSVYVLVSVSVSAVVLLYVSLCVSLGASPYASLCAYVFVC